MHQSNARIFMDIRRSNNLINSIARLEINSSYSNNVVVRGESHDERYQNFNLI